MEEGTITLKKFFADYGKIVVATLSALVVVVSCVVVVHTRPQQLTVSFLDVGQGDAILIQTPHKKTMLIDGGPGLRVVDELSHKLSFFNRSLDVVIATHPDSDHTTGLIPVLEKYDVNNIVTSSAPGDTNLFIDLEKHIQQENADVHVAKRGDVIDFHDGVKVFIIHPQDTRSVVRDTNSASVSVVLMYGDHSFLLTGDLPSTQETRLLTSATVPRNVTVFKAGHHGSNTSSGERLLSYIRPEYAVISAGKDNRYGHPHEDTLTRLQKYSKEIFTTADRGTISFVSNGRVLNVVTQK
jgi:competence protein ComEC